MTWGKSAVFLCCKHKHNSHAGGVEIWKEGPGRYIYSHAAPGKGIQLCKLGYER